MEPTGDTIRFDKYNWARLSHNFLMREHKGDHSIDDINLLTTYLNYVLDKGNRDLPSYKVGLVFIGVNAPYWQYITPVVQDVKNAFLPGHEVEVLLFTDLPSEKDEKAFIEAAPTREEITAALAKDPNAYADKPTTVDREYLQSVIPAIRSLGATIFPIESVPWPYPTLMRYHVILEQEEYLKKFDYVFYMDVDMRIINIVGDEILGDGITAAQHPMYALDKKFFPPYEPNPSSASYIPRPGRVKIEDNKPRFEPLYFAGGFQGGKTALFLEAIKKVKELVSTDLTNNYIPVWNDESAWNRYLFDNPPSVVLSPSYIYPDSMITEYYVKLWGRNYTPRIVTLTKPFTVSKEGGRAAAEMIKTL